jgi:MSHA pilin protein MshD
MYSKKCHGFTLIEMVMAIVIISVGLAGVLSAYQVAVKSSSDPLIYKQMLSIAEEMMEEVLLKPYAPASGTISGCNRANADDISDYASYTDQAICDIDGVAVAGLSNYTVSVAVDAGASLGSISTDVKKITVTVKRGTSDTFSIVGWRTDYAL